MVIDRPKLKRVLLNSAKNSSIINAMPFSFKGVLTYNLLQGC